MLFKAVSVENGLVFFASVNDVGKCLGLVCFEMVFYCYITKITWFLLFGGCYVKRILICFCYY